MQRILLQFGGPLLCIALTIGLLLTGKASISGAQATASSELTLETPDMSDVPSLGEDGPGADASAGASELTDAGDAGDDAVPPLSSSPPEPPPPVSVSPLPPPSSSPFSPPSPVPPGAESGATEETILRHPVALAAGLVAFGDRAVQIEGLKPEAPDRVCAQGRGTWPCGAVARTAFRNFIRARAFTCQTPADGWTGTTTARCRVGTDDPALWLAANGWAEPGETEGTLRAAADGARQTGKGFYRKSAASQAMAPAP